MPLKVLIFVLTICLSTFAAVGQTSVKKCSKSTTKNNVVVPKKTTPKYVKINLPANYKPPVADEKLITFPETSAGEKKQKQLLKKRKKSKKAKKQGCVASNM